MDNTVNHLFIDNYTPVGDLCVLAICWLILILLFFSYNRKTAAFRTFTVIVPMLMAGAMLDVSYNWIGTVQGAVPLFFVLRCLYHAALFTLFFLFTLYITQVTHLEKGKQRAVLWCSAAVLFTVVSVDAVRNIQIANSPAPTTDASGTGVVFLVGYILFSLIEIGLLTSVRNRLYKRVMWGFYGAVILAFLVQMMQRVTGNTSSFTVLTFLLPVLAMFYIMHASRYDAELGAIDSTALEDTIRFYHEKNRHFIFISLVLSDFDSEGKVIPDSIRAMLRKSSVDIFRGSLLFQVSNGMLFLIFRKSRNPDYEHRIEKMLASFRDAHRTYQYDYKIVIGESIEEISRKNEYVSFVRNVFSRMEENTVRRVSPDDVVSFDRAEYILQELEDIDAKRDLDDRRVLVYCQPVYNLKTSQYDTAEALMRLQLDELGLVSPVEFIPIAEKHGFIHTLTEIILHKTCEEIRRMTAGGYLMNRISVNVSMLELKNEHFCGDVLSIIDKSGIPQEKIAIELTESQTEADFHVMKDKIAELKAQGIKFYLDDFGTGYSNMERIFELPFDIIKFDRSLVVASGHSARSEKIVSNMANMFRDLNYSVLYEGVETESDEEMCREMSASYLQGFRYSRPIPIGELRRFAQRKGKAG